MTDKRDAVIGQARQFTAEHEYHEFYTAVAYSGYKHAIEKLNEMMADFAIHHASDVRRQIADELDAMPIVWGGDMRDYIKELRGNK